LHELNIIKGLGLDKLGNFNVLDEAKKERFTSEFKSKNAIKNLLTDQIAF
jgi:predicted nucleic acid-binding OB-fold protein